MNDQPDLFHSIAPNQDGKLEVPYDQLADALLKMKSEGVWESRRMDVDRRRGLYVLHLQRIQR